MPLQLLLSIFKEKVEPCFVIVVYLWNVFDPFQQNVLLMKKSVFP